MPLTLIEGINRHLYRITAKGAKDAKKKLFRNK